MTFNLEHGTIPFIKANSPAAAYDALLPSIRFLFDAEKNMTLSLNNPRTGEIDVSLIITDGGMWNDVTNANIKGRALHLTPSNMVSVSPVTSGYPPFAIALPMDFTSYSVEDCRYLSYTQLTTDNCKAVAIWTGANGAPNVYNTLWNIATTKKVDKDGNTVNKLAMFGGSYTNTEKTDPLARKGEVGLKRCLGWGSVVTSDSIKTDGYYYAANLNTSMTKFEPLYGRLSEPFCDGVYLITDQQAPSISNEGWIQLNGERYFQLGLFLFKE